MAKIGTAHVEIKPVLNEEALAEVTRQIEEAVRKAVAAGLAAAERPLTAGPFTTTWNGPICPVCQTRYLGSHTCGGVVRS